MAHYAVLLWLLVPNLLNDIRPTICLYGTEPNSCACIINKLLYLITYYYYYTRAKERSRESRQQKIMSYKQHYFEFLLNCLRGNNVIDVNSYDIEEFMCYCKEHGVSPQGGAFICSHDDGRVLGQFFYL